MPSRRPGCCGQFWEGVKLQNTFRAWRELDPLRHLKMLQPKVYCERIGINGSGRSKRLDEKTRSRRRSNDEVRGPLHRTQGSLPAPSSCDRVCLDPSLDIARRHLEIRYLIRPLALGRSSLWEPCSAVASTTDFTLPHSHHRFHRRFLGDGTDSMRNRTERKETN